MKTDGSFAVAVRLHDSMLRNIRNLAKLDGASQCRR
jgi:hypothetical protein